MMGPEGGWVENMTTKQRTVIHRGGRQYVMDIEVRARNNEDQLDQLVCQGCEERGESAFSWQDFLP